MARINADNNVLAFLDMLAYSEIGQAMLEDKATNDGYRVLVGSLPNRLILFSDYSDHPSFTDREREYKAGHWSTAAGRYQILSKYWPHYKKQLGLDDFSPPSQDLYAVQQIKEQNALDNVKAGQIKEAIKKCANIWASLPLSQYAQHHNTIDDVLTAYKKAGGVVAG